MFSASEILTFWFYGLFDPEDSLDYKSRVWVGSDSSKDRLIRRRMIAYTTLAAEGVLDDWSDSEQGVLALVLLLDRINRICYRNGVIAFANDKKARALSRQLVRSLPFKNFSVVEAVMLLFPLIVSERVEEIEMALSAMARFDSSGNAEESRYLSDINALASRNLLLIQRFGRYPHRARMLGKRLSSDEEEFVRAYSWQAWI